MSNTRWRLLLLGLTFFVCFNGIRVGADRVLEKKYFQWIKGKRVGLITNPTGVNSRLELTADILARTPLTSLAALFGPEHGLYGAAQAGEQVSAGAAYFSLYGENLAPTPEMLRNVDVLMYDIQDVGVRFYTYISTLFETMRVAAERRLPLIVLDRPNPIGGTTVGGPVLESGFESFVGTFRIPIRYGMTIGELAALMNHEAGINCDLRVVPMEGWKRPWWYEQTGLEWIIPSPNMPTLSTAIVYPGTCLVEGTSLSEGRGTTRPFEFIGAPWLDGTRLAKVLNGVGLRGVYFRPQAFTPSFSKYQGEVCEGIQIHVLDRDKFEPLLVALHLLAAARRLHPDKFQIAPGSFDRLAGTARLRERLLAGDSPETIIKSWQDELKGFSAIRETYLLY
jgi:uncharacterized protein YbbC (DUF1343 family)